MPRSCGYAVTRVACTRCAMPEEMSCGAPRCASALLIFASISEQFIMSLNELPLVPFGRIVDFLEDEDCTSLMSTNKSVVEG